jgi:hypothetical protein
MAFLQFIHDTGKGRRCLCLTLLAGIVLKRQ